jgi:hypothetical protein
MTLPRELTVIVVMEGFVVFVSSLFSDFFPRFVCENESMLMMKIIFVRRICAIVSLWLVIVVWIKASTYKDRVDDLWRL